MIGSPWLNKPLKTGDGFWQCPHMIGTDGAHCPKCPHRVERKRTKGWKMPPNTVYVGRPSRWGNPFVVGKLTDNLYPVTQIQAVAFFAQRMERNKDFRPDLFEHFIRELRGKNLACWCPLDQPCHADVLLGIANRP